MITDVVDDCKKALVDVGCARSDRARDNAVDRTKGNFVNCCCLSETIVQLQKNDDRTSVSLLLLSLFCWSIDCLKFRDPKLMKYH